MYLPLPNRLSRRRFLKLAGATGVAVAASGLLESCGTAGGGKPVKGGTLNVMAYELAVDRSFGQEFEKKFDAKLNVSIISSPDEIVTKIRNAPRDYDVFVSSPDTTEPLVRAGVAIPLDRSRVPNLSQLYPAFQGAPGTHFQGKLYAVPFDWGAFTCLRPATVIPASENPTADVFWDPKYAGNVTLYDDILSIGVGAAHLGYDDWTNLTDRQLAQVKSDMIKQKRLLRKYWSTVEEASQLFGAGEVVIGSVWQGFILSALDTAGKKGYVETIYPNSVWWHDDWLISSGSQKQDLAYEFINWSIDGAIAAKRFNVMGLPQTTQTAAKYLPQAVVQQFHLSEPSFFESVKDFQWMAPYPRRPEYLKTWQEIKAA